MIDYRTYIPGDDQWLLREHLLLNSIENSIMAEQCRMLIPGLESGESRVEIFDKLIGYELPWILKKSKVAADNTDLTDVYNKAIEAANAG